MHELHLAGMEREASLMQMVGGMAVSVSWCFQLWPKVCGKVRAEFNEWRGSVQREWEIFFQVLLQMTTDRAI